MGVRRGWGVAAAAATIVLVLGGCSSGSSHGGQHPSAVGNTTASGHPAAQPVVAADAARATGSQKALLTKVATSHLVFLRAAEYARLRNYADVSGGKQQQYLSIFQPIIGG